MLQALIGALALSAFAWTDPGARPYMGDVADAVRRYSDIPPEESAALRRRMSARQFDAIVEINRGGIQGGFSDLRDMHFGDGQLVRGPISTASWPASRVERALVYCEGEFCVAVPTICRNVSRVTRLRAPPAAPPSVTYDPESPEGSFSARLGSSRMDQEHFIPDVSLALPPLRALAASGSFADGSAARQDGPQRVFWPSVDGLPLFEWQAPSWPAFSVPAAVSSAASAPVAAPIPEPGTWAMLLAGFAMVWLKLRRRR